MMLHRGRMLAPWTQRCRGVGPLLMVAQTGNLQQLTHAGSLFPRSRAMTMLGPAA
jgi:hypothetical protein